MKNKKNAFSFSSLIYNFSDIIDSSLKYIKESRKYIYFVVILFVLSAFIGFFFPNNFRFIDIILRQIIEKAGNLRGIDLIVFIFNNNVTRDRKSVV
jgi:hypothetical protein